MNVINQKVQTDSQGNLQLNIPTELPETDFELIVVMQPVVKYYKDDELNMEEVSLIEERLEEYKKNPDTNIPWEQVRKEIKEKYGI